MAEKGNLWLFRNVRKSGIAAIVLKEDDELIEVKLTDGNRNIFIATAEGQCMCFNEKDVRSMGRVSMGVRGVSLRGDDRVVGMQTDADGSLALMVTENGLGKRTKLEEFTPHHRGGKGMICYKINEKTGKLVGFKTVDDDCDIMMVTTGGIIIRIHVKDVSVQGRSASGVKVMNITDDVKVAGITAVEAEEETDEEVEE